MCKDGLYDVLEKVRNADGLIIGSPNYLGDMTAGLRALYERLIFQSLTYNREEPNCNKNKIPVLLITTSNCDEAFYEEIGYNKMLAGYKRNFDNFVGPTDIFICGDTLQAKDYSKYNWTMFNPEAKKAHHEETFDSYLENAFNAGKKLAGE